MRCACGLEGQSGCLAASLIGDRPASTEVSAPEPMWFRGDKAAISDIDMAGFRLRGSG